ncbi:hypothetical protein B9Z55_027127 [Caenorhabditis nigoni]|uniref:Uncharacterized protein n=1 Tax=Caenorhabditis nigoni TaxID=1611254 RepID=A0A2G5SJ17_9PELO|nr:hypothetical protein B9Z55_027127 [Caenorhabditis nigoni]
MGFYLSLLLTESQGGLLFEEIRYTINTYFLTKHKNLDCSHSTNGGTSFQYEHHFQTSDLFFFGTSKLKMIRIFHLCTKL